MLSRRGSNQCFTGRRATRLKRLFLAEFPGRALAGLGFSKNASQRNVLLGLLFSDQQEMWKTMKAGVISCLSGVCSNMESLGVCLCVHLHLSVGYERRLRSHRSQQKSGSPAKDVLGP